MKSCTSALGGTMLLMVVLLIASTNAAEGVGIGGGSQCPPGVRVYKCKNPCEPNPCRNARKVCEINPCGGCFYRCKGAGSGGPICGCTKEYMPVTCSNGKTYANRCLAKCEGAMGCKPKGCKPPHVACLTVIDPVVCDGGVRYSNQCYADLECATGCKPE